MRIHLSVFLFAATAMARTGFWAPAEPPRARYSVDISWSEESQRLEGSETIRFRNSTGKPFGRLAFAWYGDVLAVRANGVDCERAPGKQSVALFDLPHDLAPGEEILLDVRFGTPWKLNAKNGSAVTSFLSPRLWWGFGTHDNYVVRLRLPPGYAAATSGVMDPATGEYRADGVRVFGLFVGKGYETAEADAGGVRVRAVFTPAGRQCAEMLLKTAVDAIGFYRQRFGFYPQKSLSIVPGSDTPQGGYPVATAMVVIHGQERFSQPPENFWKWITAHEIGHQYWSEHVLAAGSDSLTWLMVGLGIHADREYRRARGIHGSGQLQTNFINGVRKGIDTTMDLTGEQMDAIKWDFNNVVEHGKSAAMLDALESVMGADTFDAVYRQTLREYAGKRLDWRDFQKLTEAASAQSLDWFFEQWVRSAKNVSYRIAGQECAPAAGEFTCTIRVARAGSLRMPVTVAARFQDGTEQRAQTERLADIDEIRFRSKTALKEVVLDPEGAVAMAEPPPNPLRDLSARISELPWTGAGQAALEAYREGLRLNVPDFAVWRKLGLTLYDGRYYNEAMDAFERLRGGEANDQFMALVWQGQILDLLGRREEALARYAEAAQVPGTFNLQHSQYNLRITKEWVAERLKAPFERK